MTREIFKERDETEDIWNFNFQIGRKGVTKRQQNLIRSCPIIWLNNMRSLAPC